MDEQARSPVRFLAPLALVVVLIAFLAIVSSSGGGSDESTSSTATPAATTTTQARTSTTTTSSSTSSKPTAAAGGAKSYTVKVGDTLGAIADKTGVALERIQELNPDVDPHAMVAGQKIRLK